MYWCGEQLVVTVSGPTGRRVIPLAQPFARVGSHPSSEVVLEGGSIAARALYLHATPDGVFCLFLDVSAAGAEHKGRWLAPDEEITVGPYQLRASLLTAEAGDRVPTDGLAVWGSAPRPLPVLMIYCGDLLKDKRRFRARLSPIGRRPQCALQLKGNNVSGFHCVLYWDRQQLWCIDLNSSNRTELNGTPITCARVNMGDRLEVGEFGLVFQRLSYGKGAAGHKSAAAADDVVAAGESSSGDSQYDDSVPPAAALSRPPARAVEPSAKPVMEPPAKPIVQPRPQEIPAASDLPDRQLRDELTAEVVRLAREREELHAQWEHTSQDLVAQIGQLHDEAARLTSERQALEQSRLKWQAEQASLATELARRSENLTQLERELASAAALLAEKLKSSEAPAPAPVAPTPAPLPVGPTAEELALHEEQRQLRAELAAERERMAHERQALEQSRLQWQAEQGALATELTRRSENLAQLERELAATTSLLAEKLKGTEAAPVPPPAPLSAAGPTADELARQEAERHEEQRQLRAELAAERERLEREREALQAQWEQAAGKVVGQIGELERQAQQLTQERTASEESRQAWQAQQAQLTEQLDQRTSQLARLETELASVSSALAEKMAAWERQAATPSPAIVTAVPPIAEFPPQPIAVTVPDPAPTLEEPTSAEYDREAREPAVLDPVEQTFLSPPSPAPEPAAQPVLEDIPAVAAAEKHSFPAASRVAEWTPPSTAPAGEARNGSANHLNLTSRDQLPLYVSDRLVELDQATQRKQLLWWSAGGIGVAAVIALAVTIWLLVF
jgi:hypothetical protein